MLLDALLIVGQLSRTGPEFNEPLFRFVSRSIVLVVGADMIAFIQTGFAAADCAAVAGGRRYNPRKGSSELFIIIFCLKVCFCWASLLTCITGV